MEELERELKQLTLNELEDHLSDLSDLLNSTKSDEINESDLDKIFRAVHSIKGNTKASGFEEIAEISHMYESKLIHAREGVSPYDDRMHAISLQFLDNLYDALEFLRRDIAHPLDFSDLKDLIEGNEEDEQSAQPEERKMHILIIDDDESVRDIIQFYLKTRFDAKFTHKSNGKDGLDAVSETIRYDLIICDYKMPEVDGKQFIFQLRNSLLLNKNSPIIFLSGYRPNLEANKTTWENVFFIEKPFTESKLNYYATCALELGKDELTA